MIGIKNVKLRKKTFGAYYSQVKHQIFKKKTDG